MSIENKLIDLKRRLTCFESAVVALSGGIDSALLAVLAHKVLDDKMCAATAVSASLPSHDRSSAISLCEKFAIKHIFFETDEFSNPTYTSNPENRCYYCKKALYTCLAKKVKELGYRYIIEGTNYSDLSGHRPGYNASKELSDIVVTPLIDCKITKQEVRELARQLNIEIADKPASACLSSRIPFGEKITEKRLIKIDQAENFVREFGINQVRLRDHNGLARLEVAKESLEVVIENKEEIYKKLTELGYRFVTLDLLGYRTGGGNL